MTEIMTASSTLVYQRAGPRLKEERQAQDGSRGKSGPRGDQHYVPRNIPSPYAPYRRFHRLEGPRLLLEGVRPAPPRPEGRRAGRDDRLTGSQRGESIGGAGSGLYRLPIRDSYFHKLGSEL